MVIMDNHSSHSYNYNNRSHNKEDVVVVDGSRPRSHGYNNKKPSFGCLEKKFCAMAGVPWKKVLETQKYMYQEKKICQWNDSAGKEAFLNAWNCFCARERGESCDVKLPDPDIFIDKIDWDSEVDPQLISDLDKRENTILIEAEKKECNVVLGIPVVPEQFTVTPTGWGDDDECKKVYNTQKHDDNYNGHHDQWHDCGVNNGERIYSQEWEDDYVYISRSTYVEKKNNGSRQVGYNKWDHRGNISSNNIPRFNCKSDCQQLDDKNGGQRFPSIKKWRPVSRKW